MKQERTSSLPKDNYDFFFLEKQTHIQGREKDVLTQKYTTNSTQKSWLIDLIFTTNSWTPNCHYPPFFFPVMTHGGTLLLQNNI